MASRKKKTTKKERKPAVALFVNLGILLMVALTLACAAVQANMVLVRRAEVTLEDLPQAFDGTTILYASDIDLCGINTPQKSGALFRQLQSLRPDLLILGGDYTSPSVFDMLNASDSGALPGGRLVADRNAFFQLLAGFETSLGKIAVASPEDPLDEGLSATLSECGFTPLINTYARVGKDGEFIELVGISSDDAIQSAASVGYNRDACVIAVAYSPSAVPKLLTTEARDSGHWTDLILTGHTHGGQIMLFGHSVLPLTSQEHANLCGWFTDTGVPILTTSGVGCEGVNMRMGSHAEVWLITLRRPAR